MDCENGEIIAKNEIIKDNVHEGINRIEATTKKFKSYTCKLCNESFCGISVFKRHVKSVHEDVKQHKCEKCGKDFNSLSALNIHINNFHEELCYKDFKNPRSLAKHKRRKIEDFKNPTGCLTTDMNKVSALFMEKSPYFIENFDHILFTTYVSFIIMPYLGKKLKGNGKKFHLEKNFKNFLGQNFFPKFFEIFFRYEST